MGFLKQLGVCVDTSGGDRKMEAFRNGWPAKTTPEISFHRTEHVQFRYRERQSANGDGPTIVFTADPPATLEVYDELFSVFSDRFRVIAVELPAMGFSAVRSGYGFGFRETNDMMALFLRDVAGPDAVLAFSCVAGLAAVDLAVRQPDLVSKIVLMQTCDVAAFARWKATRDPKGVLARPIIGQLVMKKIAPKRMPDWYDLAVGNREKIGHLCACAAESFDHGVLWSLASAFQNYMRDDTVLGQPTQPILSLWGLADGSHPDENSRSSKNFADHVEQVIFKDLGHFSELEDPHRVHDVICQFVFNEDGLGQKA